MKNLFFILIMSALITSCSSKPTEAEVAAPAPLKKDGPTLSIETKQLAAEQSAKNVVEIKFNKSKFQLTPEIQAQIKKFLNEVSKTNQIEEIKIVSWGDSEYPSAEKKQLSDKEKQLAKKRNEAIHSYIEKNFPKEIKLNTYSMAERPDALTQFISSSEARIKKSLEVAGIPTTETGTKAPPKASHAIILAIIK